MIEEKAFWKIEAYFKVSIIANPDFRDKRVCGYHSLFMPEVVLRLFYALFDYMLLLVGYFICCMTI